jgi:hypothetical protein
MRHTGVRYSRLRVPICTVRSGRVAPHDQTSDQHKVKLWLSERLGIATSVPDLTQAGYQNSLSKNRSRSRGSGINRGPRRSSPR